MHTDFALARYMPNGSLDPVFGGGGRVTTDFRDRDVASDVHTDSRGRIVAAGTGFDASSDHPTFEVARYKRHGRLDRTFAGNGKARLPHGHAYAVGIDRRDRPVAGGKSAGKFTLARYRGERRRR